MKRSFNFKNITTSMLAIMLCVAMIFSFSLSVYAEIVGTVFMLTGDGYQICRAIGALDKNYYWSYDGYTQIIQGEAELSYMDVFVALEDTSEEGVTDGFDFISPEYGDAVRDVEVTVESNYYI